MKKSLGHDFVGSRSLHAFRTSSCNNGNTAKTATVEKAKTENKDTSLPNYRYVDLDTILSKYNLAKDYNEGDLRMQTNMESAYKRHQSKLQSFANTVQNKMQNNGYLSEASYKQMSRQWPTCRTRLRKTWHLRATSSEASMQAQKTVNDSIEAFIKGI